MPYQPRPSSLLHSNYTWRRVCELWSSLCSFLQRTRTLSLLTSNMFWNSLCFFLDVTNLVSHPHRTTGQIAATSRICNHELWQIVVNVVCFLLRVSNSKQLKTVYYCMPLDDGRMTETCCVNIRGEEELLRWRTINCLIKIRAAYAFSDGRLKCNANFKRSEIEGWYTWWLMVLRNKEVTRHGELKPYSRRRQTGTNTNSN
jgi:hypothetical protein